MSGVFIREEPQWPLVLNDLQVFNNVLMQINFNDTNFINAAYILCLTRGPTRS